MSWSNGGRSGTQCWPLKGGIGLSVLAQASLDTIPNPRHYLQFSGAQARATYIAPLLPSMDGRDDSEVIRKKKGMRWKRGLATICLQKTLLFGRDHLLQRLPGRASLFPGRTFSPIFGWNLVLWGDLLSFKFFSFFSCVLPRLPSSSSCVLRVFLLLCRVLFLLGLKV